MNSTKNHSHDAGLNRRQMLLAGFAAAAPVWGGKRIDRSRFSAITDE
ncbi:MAG: hypothetical protein JJE04_25475, partial [Acidobacteriia bacterium]|nr:hypothetical protein [Terriglobia bacterium]